MRIDLPANDVWDAVSDQYRSALGAVNPLLQDPALQVQAYMGYQHALWEVTQGLAKLFSHKKTIAIFEHAEPAFASIATAFSSEGYTIKVLTEADVANPAEWLEPIQNELLFVLYSQDHPVTGRLYENEALLAALKDKRIFKISISHALHCVRELQRPLPFDVRILSLSPERALLFAGERCRVSPPVVSRLPWSLGETETIKAECRVLTTEELGESKGRVEEFEANLPEGFQPYFKPSENRLFDRAVIYHPELDGCAVIDQLAREAGTHLPSPGQASPFETTSPCRWENPRFAEWLLFTGESEEIVRGMVVISADQVTPGLKDLLNITAQSIRKLQSGE